MLCYCCCVVVVLLLCCLLVGFRGQDAGERLVEDLLELVAAPHRAALPLLAALLQGQHLRRREGRSHEIGDVKGLGWMF